MDFLLFFIGLISLFKGRTHSVITIITILSSRYLQLPIHSSFAVNFLFPHNVEDVGLLLYIIWFITYLAKGRVVRSHPMIKYVVIFYLFLVASSIYDVSIGTPLGDTIKYMRQWLLLTVVFIAPNISLSTIKQSLKQLTTITIYICLYLLFIRITHITDVLELTSADGRGIKPPSYTMICSLLVWANPWGLTNSKKYTYLIILMLPVILSLKITYTITIVALIMLYTLTKRNIDGIKRVITIVVIVIGVAFFASSASEFMGRVSEITTNLSTLSLEDIESEDNFTYRLAHSSERLQYILKSPDKMIRGLGFITEKNYKREEFIIGLWDEDKNMVTQLDTGDIAWSILFLRLGLLGLAIYLCGYFKLIAVMIKNRAVSDIYGIYAVVFIVFLTFTSLGNTIITMGEFFFIPLLITNYSKLRYENSSRDLVA